MAPRPVVLVITTLVALAAATADLRPAEASRPTTLRIVFPEGFTVRQMTDRVATVRRIAIAKRHVTPRLTGAAYATAAARAGAPRAFRSQLKRRTIEGFLFPALYEFEPYTRAHQLVANQITAFERAWRTVDLRRARARGRTA